MSDRKSQIRWDLVERARERIESGFHGDPEILDTILGECGVAARILGAIDAVEQCGIGAADEFRDAVAVLLLRVLGQAVDLALMRRESAVDGCSVDIDLPIRTELLSRYPLWDSWCRKYDVRRLIVESKNTRRASGADDVVQTQGYLGPSTGRLGFLVSRQGFTRNAKNRMAKIAQRGEELILPFDSADLRGLADARQGSEQSVMAFLRRKETLLLQG